MGFMLAVVTSLPTWAFWTLAFGSPGLTILAQYFGRRGMLELEARSRREEVMRNLRWAAELGVSNDAAKSLLGIKQLEVLRESKLLTNVEQEFIDAALKVAVQDPHEAIAQAAGEVNVIVEVGANAAGETPVPSEEGEQGEEADV